MQRSRILLTSVATMVVFGMVLFTACRKNKQLNEDTGYASEHATSEQVFNDVQDIADQGSVSTGGTLGYKTTGSGCATVTKEPGKITIDFGATNCMCKDGRNRRGKLLITYTGNYADAGSVHTITFDNFYQNDNKITGTKTVTNMGLNAQGQPYFNVHIEGSVTKAGGGTVTTLWNRVRTWTKGYATLTDKTDDGYSISGSGTLTRANGAVVSISIGNPLIVEAGCRWVEAGSVTYTLAGGGSRVLNYGDSPNCDDQATVTLANGTVRAITLP